MKLKLWLFPAACIYVLLISATSIKIDQKQVVMNMNIKPAFLWLQVQSKHIS
jgi:hypothetical protein